jgi:hypothetical protein
MMGIDVAQSTVAQYAVPRSRLSPSQRWKTFLHNHTPGIASIDLFVVPTAFCKLLDALVILGHGHRRLVGFGVAAYPSAEWVARQLTESFPWDEAPRYPICDRNGAFDPSYTRRIRAMGIRDRAAATRSPWKAGHAARRIGSIRGECLDHVIVFGQAHLRRAMKAYASHNKHVQTHLALDKNAPEFRHSQPLGNIGELPLLGSLRHHYVRI